MVNLDLKNLAAPIEALRPSLTEAYKRLDAKWDEIVNCLKELPIPCAVSFTYDRNDYRPDCYACLVWKKWNGKKRICVEFHSYNPEYDEEEVDTIPYDEWSGEQRIAMLEHVPGLFKAAEVQTKEFIAKTKI